MKRFVAIITSLVLVFTCFNIPVNAETLYNWTINYGKMKKGATADTIFDIKKGSTLQIKIYNAPKTYCSYKVTSGSDTFKVNKSGKITCKGTGNGVITVTGKKRNGKEKTMTVKVNGYKEAQFVVGKKTVTVTTNAEKADKSDSDNIVSEGATLDFSKDTTIITYTGYVLNYTYLQVKPVSEKSSFSTSSGDLSKKSQSANDKKKKVTNYYKSASKDTGTSLGNIATLSATIDGMRVNVKVGYDIINTKDQ